MSDLPEPIPAATLILMRASASGPPELLMIERTATMVFAAGALVFPGGRIDAEDHAAAAQLGAGFPDAAARIAAIRETIEETGVVPALRLAPDARVATLLRDGLERGEPFADLLLRQGLSPDLAALAPFARWCPNFRETRRFDALFYLAEAPPGNAATPLAAEANRAFWISARQVLDEHAAGREHLIFPTRRNLERLARFGSIEEARDDAAHHPVQKITPWIETRAGRDWLCIPEDAGYPVTAEPMDTVRRG